MPDSVESATRITNDDGRVQSVTAGGVKVVLDDQGESTASVNHLDVSTSIHDIEQPNSKRELSKGLTSKTLASAQLQEQDTALSQQTTTTTAQATAAQRTIAAPPSSVIAGAQKPCTKRKGNLRGAPVLEDQVELNLTESGTTTDVADISSAPENFESDITDCRCGSQDVTENMTACDGRGAWNHNLCHDGILNRLYAGSFLCHKCDNGKGIEYGAKTDYHDQIACLCGATDRDLCDERSRGDGPGWIRCCGCGLHVHQTCCGLGVQQDVHRFYKLCMGCEARGFGPEDGCAIGGVDRICGSFMQEGKPIIECCQHCKLWFHTECVGASESIEDFVCPICAAQLAHAE